jgi:ribosomal protein S18 acetylase RimI-like enzyme
VATPGVATLTAGDLRRLRTTGNPRVDETDIRAVLELAPDQSFWMPETGEFILVAPWRHRPELPAVHTLWSFSNDAPLIAAALAEARDRGAAALIMLETGERRRMSFYHQHGFSRIEIIRTYEHMEPEVLARGYDSGVQRFTQVTPNRPDLITLVTRLDHAAFPWFWWNSIDEFNAYLRFPGVEVWAGIRDDEVLSYIGFTSFHRWAHLDRIAVDPERQGQGLGRSAIAFAAQRMIRGGATRIGLSTQSSNRVSRHLYETLGFRHTRQSDYDVYGIVIDPDLVYRPAGTVSESDRG